MDTAEAKRVELHCHTKASDMDGVSFVRDIVKTAYNWGMPAVAITDHGSCSWRFLMQITSVRILWKEY